MSDNRAFEGVWIPASLWLDSSLSLQEKVMLVEIKSLSADKRRGCYKTNKKFAEFFGLSVSRVSEVIGSLKKKGFITIVEQREGKQIIERNIFLTEIAQGVFGIPKGYSENAMNPIRNPEGGYSEKAKERSTYLSNTDRDIEPPSESHAPGGDAPAPVETKSSSSRGTRLPQDWTLTNEYREAALAARPDLANRLNTIADNFRDYWHAATGKSAAKRDWLAAWRFWVRNERQGTAQFKTAAEKRSERAAATYDYQRATTF